MFVKFFIFLALTLSILGRQNFSKVLSVSISDSFINKFKNAFIELTSEKLTNLALPDFEGWYGYLFYKAYNIIIQTEKFSKDNVVVEFNEEQNHFNLQFNDFKMQVNFDLLVSLLLFNIEIHVDVLVFQSKLTTSLLLNMTEDHKLATDISSMIFLNKEDLDIRFSKGSFAFLLNYVKTWFISVLFLKIHSDYQIYVKQYQNLVNQIIHDIMKEYSVTGPYLMEYSLVQQPKIKKNEIQLDFECYTYLKEKKHLAFKPSNPKFNIPDDLSTKDFSFIVSEELLKSAFKTSFTEGLLKFNFSSNNSLIDINFSCKSTAPIDISFSKVISIKVDIFCISNYSNKESNEFHNFEFFSTLFGELLVGMNSHNIILSLSKKSLYVDNLIIRKNSSEISWFQENLNLFLNQISDQANLLMNHDQITLNTINFLSLKNIWHKVYQGYFVITTDIDFEMEELRKIVNLFVKFYLG